MPYGGYNGGYQSGGIGGITKSDGGNEAADGSLAVVFSAKIAEEKFRDLESLISSDEFGLFDEIWFADEGRDLSESIFCIFGEWFNGTGKFEADGCFVVSSKGFSKAARSISVGFSMQSLDCKADIDSFGPS